MGFEFDEPTIKEAFNNAPTGIQELLSGDELTNDIVTIGNKYSLSSDDIELLIQELGFMLLGLKEKKENYSNFIVEKIHNDFPEGFINEINRYFDSTHDRAIKFVPIETKAGDKTVFTASNPNAFFVTKDYFKLRRVGQFPHSYVRNASIIYMSGFNELGFSGAVGSIIFGLIVGGISIYLIATLNIIWIIVGLLGMWGAWEMLKSPFRKAKPNGYIEFHPNLGLEDINLSLDGESLSDDDIVEGIKAIRKYMNY